MSVLNTLRLDYARWKWGKAAARTPFKGLYQRTLPKLRKSCAEQDFLVVDCEMSGLNPARDSLLSIGWVRIRQMQIDYGSRRHVLMHSPQAVGDSVVIHGLSDQQLAGAASASKALSLLAHQAEDTVLVFHHAVLDLAFLQRCARQTFACPMPLAYVDTMLIEKRRLDRQGKSASLQLNLCRDRYGLPPAFAHNAMSDAVATAELFLAQCAHLKTRPGRGDGEADLGQLGLQIN